MSVIGKKPWCIVCPYCGLRVVYPQNSPLAVGGPVCTSCGGVFSFRKLSDDRYETTKVDPDEMYRPDN
jgi:transposase-like protein